MSTRYDRDPSALATAPVWAPEPADAQALREPFDSAAALTLGLEEELMLLYADTLALAPEVDALLARVADGRVRDELRAAQVELVTPVCESAAEAGGQLADARLAALHALPQGRRLAAAGTHPFSSDWGEVAAGDRYALIADEYAWAARRSLACGLHVHVAVGGADRTLAVYNALRSFLPEIGALAANSPFFEGQDTGLSSVRPKLNEAFPRAGVPPPFPTWDEYAALLDWGRAGGLFPDSTHVWWDLRLHPGFGTLEVRVADAQTRVEDAAAIGALVHCLVAWLARRHDRGERLPVHDSTRIHENAWRALRHGVRGWLVDCGSGRREPTRERIAALLDELEPLARRLRCELQLFDARTLLAGNGAERQRYVEEREGVFGLARWLADQTQDVWI